MNNYTDLIRDSKTKLWYVNMQGAMLGPHSQDELRDLVESKHYTGLESAVHRDVLNATGANFAVSGGLQLYKVISQPMLNIDPDTRDEINRITSRNKVIFIGPNNGGKTFTLKLLKLALGESAFYVGTNRFYHLDNIIYTNINDNDRTENQTQSLSRYFHSHQNADDCNFQVNNLIAQLDDDKRESVFGICTELIGEEFKLVRKQKNNTLSPFVVYVGDHELAYTSTGTRLVLSLISICCDSRYDSILIDEPEIGLYPKLQEKIANLLIDDRARKSAFPHIQRLFIATHSMAFLDNQEMQNNCVVHKDGDYLHYCEIDSPAKLYETQFNMLGNSLETFRLPSVIVVVEGPSDRTFISKLLSIHFDKYRISVVESSGDGGVANVLDRIDRVVNGINKSPYHNRIVVVLDNVNSVNKSRISNKGVHDNNIVILSKNGIEYYYPRQVLHDLHMITEIVPEHFNGDNTLTINGRRIKKKELSTEVSIRITREHDVSHEIKTKLFYAVSSALGIT